jgi:hypothetical protein
MLMVEAELRRLKVGQTVLKSILAKKWRPNDPKSLLDELRRFETDLLSEVDGKAAQERERFDKLFDLLLRDDVEFGDNEA